MITTATVVIAIFTIVLSLVTWLYARSTKKILLESQESRKATQSLADSSKESLQLLKRQAEQASAIGSTIVASAINAARTNIDQWRRISILSYAVSGHIPENVNLVPLNAESAVEHAHLISRDGTLDLMSGFENLRRASWELNFISKFKDTVQTEVHNHAKNALKYMEDASADLEAARTYFAEAKASFTEKPDPEGSRF
jgi:hypothetical protein